MADNNQPPEVIPKKALTPESPKARLEEISAQHGAAVETVQPWKNAQETQGPTAALEKMRDAQLETAQKGMDNLMNELDNLGTSVQERPPIKAEPEETPPVAEETAETQPASAGGLKSALELAQERTGTVKQAEQQVEAAQSKLEANEANIASLKRQEGQILAGDKEIRIHDQVENQTRYHLKEKDSDEFVFGDSGPFTAEQLEETELDGYVSWTTDQIRQVLQTGEARMEMAGTQKIEGSDKSELVYDIYAPWGDLIGQYGETEARGLRFFDARIRGDKIREARRPQVEAEPVAEPEPASTSEPAAVVVETPAPQPQTEQEPSSEDKFEKQLEVLQAAKKAYIELMQLPVIDRNDMSPGDVADLERRYADLNQQVEAASERGFSPRVCERAWEKFIGEKAIEAHQEVKKLPRSYERDALPDDELRAINSNQRLLTQVVLKAKYAGVPFEVIEDDEGGTYEERDARYRAGLVGQAQQAHRRIQQAQKKLKGSRLERVVTEAKAQINRALNYGIPYTQIFPVPAAA